MGGTVVVFLKPIAASSMGTLACFMRQENHTRKLISTVYRILNFAADMGFVDFSEGEGDPAP